MDIVAGPQGSGKSTFFRVADRGFDSFNVDERRRELNRGSAQGIPDPVRERSVRELQAFIESHIREGRSFSFEATLAREVMFEQASQARGRGFEVLLTYVATDLDECVERVMKRLELGGHGVPAQVIAETYAASMRNLTRAIRQFDVVHVWDNSVRAGAEISLHEAKPSLRWSWRPSGD
jgi:predicted ABC-type ATPase